MEVSALIVNRLKKYKFTVYDLGETYIEYVIASTMLDAINVVFSDLLFIDPLIVDSEVLN